MRRQPADAPSKTGACASSHKAPSITHTRIPLFPGRQALAELENRAEDERTGMDVQDKLSPPAFM